jgi:hypothetical protein
MKRLPGQGARDRAIRTDDPQVESQLLHDWQGKGVTPSRDYDDLDSFRIGPAYRCHIRGRDLKFGVQEGAIDVDTQKADGRLH